MSFCVQGDPFYLGQQKCQEELWGEREIGKMCEKVQQENQLGIAGLMAGNNLVHQRWGLVREFYFGHGNRTPDTTAEAEMCYCNPAGLQIFLKGRAILSEFSAAEASASSCQPSRYIPAGPYSMYSAHLY